jgi:DNA helicase IV
MALNARVIFEGPAGTGKTLLALEAVRRGHAGGGKVLFLCFNRLLGKWLEGQTAPLSPRVRASTLHRQMLRVAGDSLPLGEPSNEFWQHTLPLRAIDALLSDNTVSEVYDELVLDEAQDCLTPQYLDFLDLSLQGGLAAGRWRFFGDFERQAIYGADISIEELRTSRLGSPPIYSLRANCRNTPRVAELVHLLGGLAPPYDRILRPDDGVEPEINYYQNDAEQCAILEEILTRLYREGFQGSSISVLSARATAPCAESLRNEPWRDRLRNYGSSPHHIGYCSIHAFKGLESPAIVVTDIEHIGDETSRALFYVAVTRAVQRLFILARGTTKAAMRQMLLSQLSRFGNEKEPNGART